MYTTPGFVPLTIMFMFMTGFLAGRMHYFASVGTNNIIDKTFDTPQPDRLLKEEWQKSTEETNVASNESKKVYNPKSAPSAFSQRHETVSVNPSAKDFSASTDAPHHQLDFPPIYWINLGKSVSRKKAMMDMFSSLGTSNAFRFEATDVNSTLSLWQSGRLIFHPDIKLESNAKGRGNHAKGWYFSEEAACTLSHLNVIKQAYDDGQELALILEDDAVISRDFQDGWSDYIQEAPVGWKILQFATNFPALKKQFVNLHDPFITWQPYHWSTRAYLVNRAGMRTLLDEAYSISEKGDAVWRLDGYPFVVADEVIYAAIGDAYTSTGLWVDSNEAEPSTVQIHGQGHSKFTIGDIERRNHIAIKLQPFTFPESLLVLMNVKINSETDATENIQWIHQDSHAVCKFYQICDWEVNVVITKSSLMESFLSASSDVPSNINFNAQVSSKWFNKFAHLQNFTDKMLDYDFVLLKDNDQRISGFPWRTFVEKKGNAVVSGPLRQSVRDAMKWGRFHRDGSHLQFHQSNAWLQTRWKSWGHDLFAEVAPIEVPMVEMYFVLFEGKFANYFFDHILTKEFIHQPSSWGPDLLWCAAAAEWSSRPGCDLVPVVSAHEDSRQIDKGVNGFREKGEEMLNYFKTHSTFGRWAKPAYQWNSLIGGLKIVDIEGRCHRLLGFRGDDRFDLRACAAELIKM